MILSSVSESKLHRDGFLGAFQRHVGEAGSDADQITHACAYPCVCKVGCSLEIWRMSVVRMYIHNIGRTVRRYVQSVLVLQTVLYSLLQPVLYYKQYCTYSVHIQVQSIYVLYIHTYVCTMRGAC